MQCDECGQWRRVPYKMWLEYDQPLAAGTAGADRLDATKPSRKRKGKRWTCDHIDPGGCQSLCVRADKKWRYGALDDRRHVARLADLSRRQREQLAQQPQNHFSRELQPLPQSDCKAQGSHLPDDPADSPDEAVRQSSSNEDNSMMTKPQGILTGQDASCADDSREETNDCAATEPDAPTEDYTTPIFSLPVGVGCMSEALDSQVDQDAQSKQEAGMPPPPAAGEGSEDIGAAEGDRHGDLIEHAHYEGVTY